jgi:ABC-2 type transport system permease protein
MNKALSVAKREFWITIRRKGYIILTFGMPFFLLIYIGIVAIPGIMLQKKEMQKRAVGIVDKAGIVIFDLAQEARSLAFEGKEIIEAIVGDVESLPMDEKEKEMFESLLAGVEPKQYQSEEEAEEAMKVGEISIYYVIPEDYMESGQVFSYSAEISFITRKGKPGFMRKLLTLSLLHDRVDPKIQERIQSPLKLTEFAMEEGEYVVKDIKKEIASIGVPIGFSIILLMSIMMSSGFLLQGVAEEKENRVIEIILSSIKPEQLLLGKLLGLGGAGFLQLLVWLGVATIPILAFIAVLNVKLSIIPIAIVYYLLGFLLIGSLMAGTGSLGSNLKESQQLTIMWTLPSVIPMVIMMLIIEEPNGIAARIFSYIPITSPVTMMIRISTGKVAMWEVLLTVLVLIGSIYLAIKIFGKVFRIGLLMYGKRPKLKEIIKAARQA